MSIDILDSGKVRIAIDGEFDGAGLTRLLHELGHARERIVQDATAPGADIGIVRKEHTGWHAQLITGTDSENDSALLFRHPAFGWVGFALSGEHRVALAEVLRRQQAHVESAEGRPILKAPSDTGAGSASR